MFRKVRKTWINATDSFAMEILRAIVRDMHGTDVYITQTLIKAKKPQPHKECTSRRYATEVMELEMSGCFTDVCSSRRHSSEGVTPLLPSFRAKFVFTNEAAGWYSWDIWSAAVHLDNVGSSYQAMHHMVIFDGSAPPALAHLANELRHRGPVRFYEDE